jgi:hypothetical protein
VLLVCGNTDGTHKKISNSDFNLIQLSMPIMTYVLATFLCIVPAIVLWKLAKKPKALLPPGPKPWPVIGNLPQMPREYEHEQYQKWAREYGTTLTCLLLCAKLSIC